MLKRLLLIILFYQFFSFIKAQPTDKYVDSLKRILRTTKDDTLKVVLMNDLSGNYTIYQVDSSILYSQRAISLARQINYKKGEAASMAFYGNALRMSGNYDKAIEIAIKALNLYRDLQEHGMIASSYMQLAVLYGDAGDYRQALRYGLLSKKLFDSLNQAGIIQSATISPREIHAHIGSLYLLADQVDAASFYIKKASDFGKRYRKEWGYLQNLLGDVEVQKKNYKEALNYYWSGIPIANNEKNYLDLVYLYNSLAKLYHETGSIDSSIYYAKEALNISRFTSLKRHAFDAITILAKDYKLKNQDDNTIKYLELSIALNDSLFNKEKTRAIQNLTFNEQLRQQEVEAAKIRYQNQVKMYVMLASLIIFLLIAFILWRNNRRKQKLNTLLQKQKEQIEKTLVELKSTQAQLIHQEKMASLGELTAGIAHEIQNPLNFVNNFSEVNGELISELVDEVDKGNYDEVRVIAVSLKDNEEKIIQHGKRADSIVKGMLQHSKTSTGVKEPTDINKLADEYLRLSYHGMRAKDKSFEVKIKTEFDESIGKVNIVSQDIGRVLLNLFNNAFYAVNERGKAAEESYQPIVSVVTKKLNDKIEIKVEDNGYGISQNIITKIFQPFFTTKPTGQGTGLGLSLAYDIITREHNGTVKVESRDGEETVFIIHLPVA